MQKRKSQNLGGNHIEYYAGNKNYFHTKIIKI